jgi:hypothetical protein
MKKSNKMIDDPGHCTSHPAEFEGNEWSLDNTGELVLACVISRLCRTS